MKHLFTIILALLLTTGLRAQTQDSLPCISSHQFTNSQVIAPAVLFYSGSIIALSPQLHNSIDFAIRDWSQADGHARMHYDDYIQFAPIVSVYALKLCGVKSVHNWASLAALGAGSGIILAALTIPTKNLLQQERPCGNIFTSFPSGHTGTAFMGAEILRREYGKEYPGIAVAGYAVATTVGLMRIYNNRHWASDILGGAGFGILSASIMYWLSPYLTF